MRFTPELSLSALIACNAIRSPLTVNVYPWTVHYKCAMKK